VAAGTGPQGKLQHEKDEGAALELLKGRAVTDPKRPGGQVLTLKPKGAPKPQEKASTPPRHPRRPKRPAYTPPRACEPSLARFWMVMRSTGRRPQIRHLTLEATHEEARRIAEK
jgi:hypothetical protein